MFIQKSRIRKGAKQALVWRVCWRISVTGMYTSSDSVNNKATSTKVVAGIGSEGEDEVDK